MNRSRSSSITRTMLAAICAAGAFVLCTSFAYADEAPKTTTASGTPAQLERDIGKLLKQKAERRDPAVVAQRVRQIEARILELKKHIEHYELLLMRLTAPEGSLSSTTKKDIKQRLQDYASSTKAKRVERRSTRAAEPQVQGASDTRPTGGMVLKVNGSEGPVYLPAKGPVNISWNSGRLSNCFMQLLSARRAGVVFATQVVSSGKGTLRYVVPAYGDHPATLRLTCGTGTAKAVAEVALNHTPATSPETPTIPVTKDEPVSIAIKEIRQNTERGTTTGPLMGDYTIDFLVTANADDIYIPKTISRSNDKTVGVNFRTEDAGGALARVGTAPAALSSMADEVGAYYLVDEGDTEEFSANMWYTPGVTGSYKVQLLRLNWNTVPKAPNAQTIFRPQSTFESGVLNFTSL